MYVCIYMYIYIYIYIHDIGTRSRKAQDFSLGVWGSALQGLKVSGVCDPGARGFMVEGILGFRVLGFFGVLGLGFRA